MSTYIDCPSGLAGHIRGLKGKEARLLSDRSAARAGADSPAPGSATRRPAPARLRPGERCGPTPPPTVRLPVQAIPVYDSTFWHIILPEMIRRLQPADGS